MTTTASKQYNEASKTERTEIRCQRTKKLLARYSGDWPAELRQWLWCRVCSEEHELTKDRIESAVAQGAGIIFI